MKKIIIAVDFSDATQPVIDYGVALAKSIKAEILLVHVIDYKFDPVDVPKYTDENDSFLKKWKTMQERGIEIAIEKLNNLAATANAEVKTTPKILQGMAAQRINQELEEQDEAALLVIGSHGHGILTKMLIGSVAERIVKFAKKPILIVPIQDNKE